MLSPYRGFRDVRSEMEQMFDEMFNLGHRPRQNRGPLAEWAPATDVLSRDGDLVIRAELPGIKQEDVDIHDPERGFDHLWRAQSRAGRRAWRPTTCASGVAALSGAA